MLKQITNLIFGTLILGSAVSANANLVVNGSFEANNVAVGGWNYFSASVVPGWEGSNIEIWDHLYGIAAPDGDQIAELNAHGANIGAWSIFQNLTTIVGQTYDVSFFYRARTGTSTSSTESFLFSVGTLLKTIDDHTTGKWSLFQSSFTATNTLTQLRFTSLNTDTYGNLLDDVVVNARANVPESSSLLLFTIGIFCLVMIRARKKLI